jgi:hypothetical protein
MRIACLAGLLCLHSSFVVAEGLARPEPDHKALAEAAVIALLIVGSVAAYKAMNKPCACPSDTMRNGQPCGARSAWSKPNGFKPLCFPTDITPSMIAAYRATGVIPRP